MFHMQMRIQGEIQICLLLFLFLLGKMDKRGEHVKRVGKLRIFLMPDFPLHQNLIYDCAPIKLINKFYIDIVII